MANLGIPTAALDFYDRLEADNSKAFWEANRDSYNSLVKAPVVALTEALSAYGEFKIFRPHNNMRFQKDRPPYKTHQGAYSQSAKGSGYYFQISADGLMAGAGYYAMFKDQLDRFRRAVDAEKSGKALVALLEALPKGYEVSAIGELKTAPRGYPKDHPRIEIIRRKGLIVTKDFGTPKWLSSPRVLKELQVVFETAKPIDDWLDKHVGPTEMETDEMFPR